MKTSITSSFFKEALGNKTTKLPYKMYFILLKIRKEAYIITIYTTI